MTTSTAFLSKVIGVVLVVVRAIIAARNRHFG
jgi:hypothetical protein